MSSMKHVTRTGSVTPENVLKDLGFDARLWVGTQLSWVINFFGEVASEEMGTGSAAGWSSYLMLEIEAQMVMADLWQRGFIG